MKLPLAVLSTLLALAPTTLTAASAEHYLKSAPFPMPEIVAPTFPERTFRITDFGAVSDGHTLATQAFANAIAACVKAGGGHVVVPPGLWITGPIVLASNVDLHAERGALIQFTPDHSQYPLVGAGGKAGFVTQSPISGDNLSNVAITGQGIFDGAGETWRPVKRVKVTAAQWKSLLASGGPTNSDDTVWWPTRAAAQGEAALKLLRSTNPNPTVADYLAVRDFLRPKLLVLSNCRNVLIEDVTLRNSPAFVCYPVRCTNLIIRGVNIFNEFWAQNGDGIDLSACTNALLYRCNVSAGDDGICMKSSGKSKSPDGALNHVVIAECTVYHAHGGFVIGSNTDGGMRYIWATHCTFIGTDMGIRVKSAPGRGGLVRDIFATDIVMKDIVGAAIGFQTTYEDIKAGAAAKGAPGAAAGRIPDFGHFTIRNILCDGARTAIDIAGLAQQPVHDILIENARIVARRGMHAVNAANLTLRKVELVTPESPAITTDSCTGIVVEN